MAERKQVNKYYPPDFDPRKHKNLDKYHNTHALRERAKKIDQGILVIRFEMPYDIWCEGCKIHIAMGVRYNAEKRKMGYYYSTPIYRFRMKCHLCENYFEIETDPKNCNYKIMFGAQRKNEKWDMAENEQVLTEDRQVVKKLAADAMFKLEHGVEDKKKLQKAAPTLSEIVDVQSGWQDDYLQNRMLRAKFRKEKKEIQLEELKDKALLTKSSLDIDLVPETEEDKRLASLLKYRTVESFDEKEQKKRAEIQSQSIFSQQSSSLKVSPPKQADTKNKQVGRLELAKRPHPAGFNVFDDDQQKRKPKCVSGIVVKRRRSDAKLVDAKVKDETEGRSSTPEEDTKLKYGTEDRLNSPKEENSKVRPSAHDRLASFDGSSSSDCADIKSGSSQRENQKTLQGNSVSVHSKVITAPSAGICVKVTPNRTDKRTTSNSSSNLGHGESGSVSGKGSTVSSQSPGGLNGDSSNESETSSMMHIDTSRQTGNVSLVGDYLTSSSDSE